MTSLFTQKGPYGGNALWYNMGTMTENFMWKLFAEATSEGLTLRAVRDRLFTLGYNLSKYSDPELIRRMLAVFEDSKTRRI